MTCKRLTIAYIKTGKEEKAPLRRHAGSTGHLIPQAGLL
jgi:hypothetical protein